MILRETEEHRQRWVDDGAVRRIGVVYQVADRDQETAEVQADVAASLEALNADFRNRASNRGYGREAYTGLERETFDRYAALAADSGIEFYHVQTVCRNLGPIYTTNISTIDRQVKGQMPPVRPEIYLNIWVANLSGGLLGYAQFPWENAPETDGVVVARGAWGARPSYTQFALNKTLSHEVGHYLGLYHVFEQNGGQFGGAIDYQDGTPEEEVQERRGDCVVDTPPQGAATTGNPPAARRWPAVRAQGETQAYLSMWMNIMDYSDDQALWMLTQDQCQKIRQLLALYRAEMQAASTETPAPAPEEPEEPEETPIPQPVTLPSLVYDFEDWTLPAGLSLLGNGFLSNNARVIRGNSYSGSRCLRLRRSGRAQLEVDLSGLEEVRLSFFYQSDGPTYVKVTPPGAGPSYTDTLVPNRRYDQIIYTLPKPYGDHPGQTYQIEIGCLDRNPNELYIDNIRLTRTTLA